MPEAGPTTVNKLPPSLPAPGARALALDILAAAQPGRNLALAAVIQAGRGRPFDEVLAELERGAR
jgi:hypothetical protein